MLNISNPRMYPYTIKLKDIDFAIPKPVRLTGANRNSLYRHWYLTCLKSEAHYKRGDWLESCRTNLKLYYGFDKDDLLVYVLNPEAKFRVREPYLPTKQFQNWREADKNNWQLDLIVHHYEEGDDKIYRDIGV